MSNSPYNKLYHINIEIKALQDIRSIAEQGLDKTLLLDSSIYGEYKEHQIICWLQRLYEINEEIEKSLIVKKLIRDELMNKTA